MNNDSSNGAEKQDFFNFLNTHKVSLKKRIENAKDIEFLAGLPFPLSAVGENAVLNMIIGDAGAGKSLKVRAVIGSILSDVRYKDDIVVYVDLEFQEQIAKQRKFTELLDYENFIYVDTELLEKLKDKYKTKVASTTIKNFLFELTNIYNNSRIIVFIDSFEDFIDDTSNDTELKRVFRSLLSLKSTTINFSHHISKNEISSNSMRFRGSMVIKAKLSALLYLKEKIDQNDRESLINLEILKMRAFYQGAKAISIVIDTDTFKMKSIDIVADKEEISILKAIYFILKENGELKKTDLRDKVREKTKKSKAKVEAVISKYSDFFDVSIQNKNTHYYSLTTKKDVIDKYLAMLGLGDSSLSDVKVNLLKELENIDDDKELNIEVKDERDTLIVYRDKKNIKSNIYTMSDFVASEILKKLEILKLQEFDEDEAVDF